MIRQIFMCLAVVLPLAAQSGLQQELYIMSPDQRVLATIDKDGAVTVNGSCEEIIKVVFTSLRQQSDSNLRYAENQVKIQDATQRLIEGQKRVISAQDKELAILRKALNDAQGGFRKIQKTLQGGKP